LVKEITRIQNAELRVESCVIARNEAIYVITYFTIIINTRRLFEKRVFLCFRKFLETKPIIYILRMAKNAMPMRSISMNVIVNT